jgi:putative DNA primase/helicase
MQHWKTFTVFLRSSRLTKASSVECLRHFYSQFLAMRAYMTIRFEKVNWEKKLEAAGITKKFPKCLSGKAGPCPLCGGGKDRFRFDNKGNLGTWMCQQCGAGNGYTLVKGFTGWGAAEVMKFLDDGTVGKTDAPERTFTFEDADFSPEKVAKNRRTLQWAWNTARPLNGRDPASRYLQKRVPGCDVTKLSKALRFHPGLDFWEQDATDKYVKRGRFPTMLAQAIDGGQIPITGHRTYLTEAGEKAPFEKVKKQMAGVRKLDGAAVRVMNVADSRVLGVTEGIENGVAVATAYRYGINVWSLLNCGNLELADIPEGRFDKIVIFADHDPVDLKTGNRPGEHHAKKLKARLEAAGYEVEIKMPPIEGTDFADLWVQYYLQLMQRLSVRGLPLGEQNQRPVQPVPVQRVPSTTHAMHA